MGNPLHGGRTSMPVRGARYSEERMRRGFSDAGADGSAFISRSSILALASSPRKLLMW